MDTRIPSQASAATPSFSEHDAAGINPGSAQAARSEIVETPAVALSIQNQLSSVQMQQAQACKKAAEGKLLDVKAVMEKQHVLRAVLVKLGEFQDGKDMDAATAKEFNALCHEAGVNIAAVETWKHADHSGWTRFWRDFADFFNGDNYRGQNRTGLNAGEKDVNNRIVSGAQEQVNSQFQSAIAIFQDLMGQYASYLDGARTSAAKANAAMSKLATGKA